LKAHHAAKVVRNIRTFLTFTLLENQEIKDEITRILNTEAAVGDKEGEEDEAEEKDKEEDKEEGESIAKAMKAAADTFKLVAKDLPVFHAKTIPQQRNGCDCGVFMLKYLEKLLKQV
tara:strand:- start:276 stop:626 length:351 start_codon:yes stop_codon:yes gene_type:complete